MDGMSGDLVMGWGSTPPNPLPLVPAAHEGRIRVRDAQASAVVSPNAMQGVAVTGAGGVILVANTLVTANTRITLTWQDGGAFPSGTPAVASRIPGTSFTIQSTVPLDVGVNVFWQLWEPAP
jgi:hypothetical protein